ncbi:dihydrofolate reductase family protein [Actinocorallia sp. B10E7]|uniref:dihydrofolate reductase family protein n=1 Tax=Actinocorallia sp. B10E7 TaxID=3153558 RepID=UPI00325D73DD
MRFEHRDTEIDASIIGRTTFGLLGGYWSKATDPEDLIAAKLNTLPEYVVSSMLNGGEADWSPTTVLRGDPVDRVRRLKELPGNELQVHGSWKLVQTLHQAGLVDVYRLLLYPVGLRAISAGSYTVDEGRSTAVLH